MNELDLTMPRTKEERKQGRLTDTYWVYSISDPCTGRVFYVGQTNNLRRRFNDHTRERNKTPKDIYISTMIANDVWPVFTILERVKGLRAAVEREGYHISQLERQGHRLLNSEGEMNYARNRSER